MSWFRLPSVGRPLSASVGPAQSVVGMAPEAKRRMDEDAFLDHVRAHMATKRMVLITAVLEDAARPFATWKLTVQPSDGDGRFDVAYHVRSEQVYDIARAHGVALAAEQVLKGLRFRAWKSRSKKARR